MSGFISSSGKGEAVSFKEAVLTNVPSEGGLFIPKKLPHLSKEDLEIISSSDFPTSAQVVLGKFLSEEIPSEELLEICKRAYNFDVPLKFLSPTLGVLELFHGPTQAFKDVGVRFMAEILQRFSSGESRTILTATSGDTGAAVANAFYKKSNIRVIVLYPKGRISAVQEQQIAGLGENVQALAVVGSFDDCQKMVNEVFSNKKLVDSHRLTSANSINLARLLPQTAYYAHAWAQAKAKTKLPLLFSVPSGNFGNICAGLIAKKIGIHIDYLLAATNDNDVVPKYLAGDDFRIKPVKETITTAMDIAIPNNFPRVESLFGPGATNIARNLYSVSVTVDETKAGMKELYSKYEYVADPHGALGYFASLNVLSAANLFRIFLETAHPVKFPDVVKETIGVELKTDLDRKIISKEIGTNPSELISILNQA